MPVTKTIRAAGCLRTIWAAAVIPSRPGIEMSLTITSGDSRSAALEEGVTVLYLRDHVELRLEEVAQQCCDFVVIVGKQQAWLRHRAFVWNALSL